MVTKNKAKGSQKKTRVKVAELKLKKETVKKLTGGEQKQIRGGWPTGGGGIDSQCTARNTACL